MNKEIGKNDVMFAGYRREDLPKYGRPSIFIFHQQHP